MTKLDKIVKSISRYQPLIDAGMSVMLLDITLQFIHSRDYFQGLASGCLSVISGYRSYEGYMATKKK